MSIITRKNFTSTFHNDTYPVLQERLKNADLANRAVFITGSGTGIGAATALSFARAGAKAVFLCGRTLSTLEETQQQILKECPNVIVEKFVFDVTEGLERTRQVFAEACKIAGRPLDILMNNAGYIASMPTTPSPGSNWDFDRYWKHFEVNVKGPLALATAFLEYASEQPTLLNISSGAAVIDFVAGLSGYGASKMAAFKMFSYLYHEQPKRGLKVFHVHPGVVATAMAKEGKSICDDTAELAADFLVWLNAPEAAFLQNRLLYVNWDVEELLAKRETIVAQDLLTPGLRGWDSTAM
ncbi:uncharacterized protein PV07_01372 [Cladophialophora immunda]|uniref:NAD(P)-binding protein n=1 Tax=Cladophialophora immunda TaxID=569365 RepID=A0A0D2CTW3_9EURO|nr:uncharacterized protein PV07_01372 [Cladophialophora immunda]KIW34598.1 hypothetical protein PV07_01372 [Cladophialophora immunda]OQV04547.1 hypothetical protein CLAIMM_09407 [Cladophialophora immunda]